MAQSLISYIPAPAAEAQTQDESILAPAPTAVSTTNLVITTASVAIPETEAREILARPVGIKSATHLTSTGTWTWDQMRDYVVGQIEARWGARPRNPLKESGIFKGFVDRWGDKSEPIARAAFEVYNGSWNGAPISIERFAKGSDAYFAAVIAQSV